MLSLIDYKEFIVAADQVMLFLSFISLAFVSLISYKEKKGSSTLISTICLVVFGAFMTSYTPWLSAAGAQAFIAGNTVQFWFYACLWFMGFMVIDCIAFVTIWKVHQRYKFSYSSVTVSYMFSFFSAGLLQALQLLNKIFFDHEVSGRVILGDKGMNEFYKYGILTINVGSTGIAVFIIACIIASRFYTPKSGKVLLWKL